MHMVMFTSSEGKAATHQTGSLEEAVKFVEHIRNNEDVSDAKLFLMTEIPIEVKAYYKVELAAPSEPARTSVLTTSEETPEPVVASA
ncbi:MAG: hypothetical protein ABR507_12230 [Actinomycetota bacterium]|nr:hypothetical protein [Actinomycetota bacterium]